MSMNLSMQSGLFDPKLARPVTVIGAGSVGSNVIDMLARIGVSQIVIYDGDEIESHNIPSSRFARTDFGRFKADAVAARILEETGTEIDVRRRYYDGTERLRGSVIASVDTMVARNMIWKAVRKNPFVDVFIDTRVAQKFFSVYCIRPCVPADIEFYEKYLYPDAETHGQQCGLHSIITTSATVAAEAVERLSNFWEDGSVRLQTDGTVGGARFFINPTSN
jgi:hypothetical protein